ncbi:MAG: NAD(P)/FAD-dependent oxidoreductase [Nitrospirae bacterium]|nr:NAD(P)/FAD-dependent oxidoreductase [Nitrospirota bacterium]
MDSVQITIIGGGVIGLSVAVELSKHHGDIVLVERHGKPGQETSSRSSEVIHSGLYYKKDSLKAKLCVEGARLLYEYCERNSVPHLKTGKLIVSVVENQRQDLEELFKRGIENGVKNLRLIDSAEVAKIEPRIKAAAAIHSPCTGIIDSHTLMGRLSTEAAANGVVFSFNTEINFIEKTPEGYVLGVKDSDYRFFSSIVVNASGLSSDRVASLAGIDTDEAGYRLSYCKGSYFSYSDEKKSPPCKMLVYPLPERQLKGLGIHATVDMVGKIRFGPDTEDIDEIDYRVDAGKGQAFFESVDKYIKNLRREAFAADMAGVRPKVKGGDFVIIHEHQRGREGFINLIGIESPGLTACISIARMVSAMVREYIN